MKQSTKEMLVLVIIATIAILIAFYVGNKNLKTYNDHVCEVTTFDNCGQVK